MCQISPIFDKLYLVIELGMERTSNSMKSISGYFAFVFSVHFSTHYGTLYVIARKIVYC